MYAESVMLPLKLKVPKIEIPKNSRMFCYKLLQFFFPVPGILWANKTNKCEMLCRTKSVQTLLSVLHNQRIKKCQVSQVVLYI